ncbi:hypothetical protein [Cellulomonas oligotrophica]|uniref:Uncharacterized protein n=1 Tax=Cellulomonas oligotrophica TaxID=931536 RepID=A0A7Y9JXI7_9CELL|nr:hypothetical protein [Cellulomonas oligotrophica]NYD84739.1 hypothetical protein [Cellulomonas oligotrophica]GIG31807.1 hypothetical protein Col01nite_09660 [Cellulomonas oligotrophica]
MLWGTVWTVLALATLAGAALIARRLWRSAVALGHELSRAADVANRLADRTAELEEIARARGPVTQPALGQDPEVLAARYGVLRAARRDRREARRERHRGTVRASVARWFG